MSDITPELTAEIERIVDQKDAQAMQTVKTVAVVVGVIAGAYVVTRRVTYRHFAKKIKRANQADA